MTENFLLDTNIYALLFNRPKTSQYYSLINKLKNNNSIRFYISEITSLEIYSVIGKYRRGIPSQRQKCTREIILPDKTKTICTNIWNFEGRKRLKPKMYRDVLKTLSDIELNKGDIQATKIKLTENALRKGTNLLIKYADKYNFGSHDALIAGSLIDSTEIMGEKMTMVTSDRGLKAVLRDESIAVFDPNA